MLEHLPDIIYVIYVEIIKHFHLQIEITESPKYVKNYQIFIQGTKSKGENIMTNQQISAVINAFRCTKQITTLQKDILDTWDTLHKNPFDTESAHKQILSNNIHYPELLAVICAMPDVIQKPFHEVTHEDMIFILQRQLEGLIAKEAGELIRAQP